MRSSVQRQKCLSFLTITFLLVSCFGTVYGVQDDPERSRAFQLYNDGNYTEALPLFEKLATANPKDREVLERLGFLVLLQTVYLKDPAERKQARVRGREILVEAQKLGGADHPFFKSLLEKVPPDGGDDTSFSTQKEVDEAMREGEAAFASANYAKALEMYERALLLDPKLYEAALFTGDVYYATAEQKKAGEWFARAVAINPDRETAYRYWGDALMKQGRVTEAGDKFVEAYIAEPYNRLARSAFLDWGQRVNVGLNHPRVEIPASVTSKQDGNVTINLDPNSLKKDDKSGAAAAWITYSLSRAGWAQTNFAKQYPKEEKYRHSLREEAGALRAAVKVYEEQKKKNSQNLDQSLETLAKLDKEGLLEAFILLALPDEGIAADFLDYRKSNVENLRRYVKQYVLTGGGQ